MVLCFAFFVSFVVKYTLFCSAIPVAEIPGLDGHRLRSAVLRHC